MTTPKVLHPGELAADYIQRRKIVRARVAKRIGVDRADFSKFLKGKKRLNTNQYILLAVILQLNREKLVMQQAQYDYAQAQDATLVRIIKQLEAEAQNGDLDRELTTSR